MELETLTDRRCCDAVDPLFSLRAAKFEFAFSASKHADLTGRESVFRGKTGFSLKRACCPFSDFRERPCDGCVLEANCLYIRLFAPISQGPGGQGSKQPPPPVRPFVISLNSDPARRGLRPGETGVAEFTLFGPAIRHSDIFLEAAAAAAGALGFRLEQIRRLSCDNGDDAPLLTDWITRDLKPGRPQPVALRFLTPTRLSTERGAAQGVITT